ncbi:MAG TPA: hypothetical protein VFL57_15475 [Bryobacteraceae bacterium]|nr:hypothetical protein [Bryobacteraceae bacterium]
MKHTVAAAALLVSSLPLFGQPAVAPAGEAAGSPRGEDYSGYNITNWFETGYRFRTVGGNLGKYRADVNFGNGIRLLASSLGVHSREGQGGWLDELLLNTQGLGNDPYQSASLRVQKNRIWRYDLLWREQDYFNPALPIARGLHAMDTSRRLQDHSLVLLPQSGIRFIAGYSRNAQDGPALGTVSLLSDEFPLFRDVRWNQDEYRAGGELAFGGLKLNVVHAWEFFRDDTRQEQDEPNAGANTGDRSTLTALRRDEPRHGSAGHWRVHLLYDRNKRWGAKAHFASAGARQSFFVDELASGSDRFGISRARQTLVFGTARRPVTAANLALNLLPSDAFTVTNHTAFHHTRMDGDGTYRELNNATLGIELVNFQFLGIRSLSNTTIADYRIGTKAAVYAGYHFADRRIRSVQQERFDGASDRIRAEQTNSLHSAQFGIRLRPLRPLSLIADAEIGRTDRAFFPTSERNYHALGFRARFRSRTVQLSAAARTNYNTNPTSLSSHGSRARNYFADASLNPLGWFGLDASYSRLHLDALTGIAYFFAGDLLRDHSYYVSNIHSGTLTARFSIRQWATFTAGFSRVEDTGGSVAGKASRIGAQSWPLAFDSPLARVSVRLHARLRWNAGYQHYRYRDDVLSVQSYRAHTGFTSLTWSF